MSLSTFMGLETALRGLLAQQRAIDVTGHNIANASTDGYSRQVADMVTTPALEDGPTRLIGTGVDVLQYTRVRDSFIDVQLRAQTMRKGYQQAQQDGLNQIELALNEPSDTGLSNLLSKYWSAWQNLANAPENMATRQALAQAAASLANGFNTLSTQITTVQTQTAQQQTSLVTQVNSIGSQIASLTSAITAAEQQGQQPNDLLDKRDLLLDQLSSFGNISVSQSAGTPGTLGSIDVTFGGTALVAGATASTVTLAGMTGLTSGQLAGLGAVITAGTGYQTTLNQLAASLAQSTNTQHALGVDLNGNPGGAFFTVTTGSEAATIAVNPALLASPALIAASAAAGTPGDASNAIAIADLQNSPLVGGATLDTGYAQLVGQIGGDSQLAQQNLANASALVDSLTNRRASVSGVSLDEEMTNLLQFQRGYQASARALTAMDDMIDQLINRTGKVGL